MSLNNSQMAAVINNGGSVSYRNRIYTTVSSLPTDDQIAADLASTRAGLYTQYTALINHNGLNAPVPTVLANTMDGVPVWTYLDGQYFNVALTGKFPAGKTTIFATPGELGGTVTCVHNANDSFDLAFSLNSIPINAPDIVDALIEIRVYQ
jgi:hypothetical protein